MSPTPARVRLSRGSLAPVIAALALAALAGAPPALAHGAGTDVATDPAGILLSWNLDLPIAISVAACAALYLWLARRVAAAHPGHRWPRRLTAAFLAGLGLIALALLSPIDAYSDELLSVHMVQHLLLTTIAPPLLAAAGPGMLLLRAATPGARARIVLPLLHSRLAQALSFPLVGWMAFVGVMWGTHFSGVYNLSLLDDRVHALEHLAYLGAACLFWWPVFSPDPTRWKLRPAVSLVYLVTQMPQMSFLSVALLDAPTPLYPAYAGRGAPFGIDALADQQVAGGVMWVFGDLAFVVAMALIVARWLLREEDEARRVDARLEREARTEGVSVGRGTPVPRGLPGTVDQAPSREPTSPLTGRSS